VRTLGKREKKSMDSIAVVKKKDKKRGYSVPRGKRSHGLLWRSAGCYGGKGGSVQGGKEGKGLAAMWEKGDHLLCGGTFLRGSRGEGEVSYLNGNIDRRMREKGRGQNGNGEKGKLDGGLAGEEDTLPVSRRKSLSPQ